MEHFRIHRAYLAYGVPMTHRSFFNTTSAPTRPTKAQLWRVPSWESARHSMVAKVAKAVAGTQLRPQPRQNPPRRGRRSLLLPVSHASNRMGAKLGGQWQPQT